MGLSAEQFSELLALEYEQRGVEFKGAGSRDDKPFLVKVIRAALGMANNRDGGLVIIGVDDSHDSLSPVGLSDDQLSSWKEFDYVRDAFATYCDPPINFDLKVYEYNQKNFVVLFIHEFEDVPVLCKRDFQSVLRNGACYVRTRRKPETSEIPSQADMRDLIELATEKRLKRFVAQLRLTELVPDTVSQNHSEHFEQEISSMTDDALEKILSRGYWKVVIRPTSYQSQRISETHLLPTISRCTVRIRGWDFPHSDPQQRPTIGSNWIQYQADFMYIKELWRLFESGQFIHFSGIVDDWFDQSDWHVQRIPPDWMWGQSLLLETAVLRITEIFNFASNLAVQEQYAPESQLYISIGLHRIENRRLQVESPTAAIPFIFQPYSSDMNDHSVSDSYSLTELIANPKSLALDVASKLLYRFGGYQPTRGRLEQIQQSTGH